MIETITRKQAVQIAALTIALTNDVRDEPLTKDECDALYKAACEAPRLAGHSQWWDAQDECGCLVGWAYGNGEVSQAVDEAAINYIEAMSQVLDDDRLDRAFVLEVID